MTKLIIQTGTDNPILRTKSTKIDTIDKSIKKLAKDLLETMQVKDGVGIAAPQVGVNKRLVIITLNEGTESAMSIPMVNPEILWHGEETYMAEEGCLSLPGIYKQVERFKEVRFKYTDLRGGEHILDVEDLNARVVQHEIDHLDGILFIDRVKEE